MLGDSSPFLSPVMSCEIRTEASVCPGGGTCPLASGLWIPLPSNTLAGRALIAQEQLTAHLCQNLSASSLSPAAQCTRKKMVPVFTEIIWVDRKSIRGRQCRHQINTWALQINVLALAMSLYSEGGCSQTETLSGTDISLPTTANSLFLMRSQLEIWYMKENSSTTSTNCEFYNVCGGTPLGNNVEKPREVSYMLGVNASYKNKSF